MTFFRQCIVLFVMLLTVVSPGRIAVVDEAQDSASSAQLSSFHMQLYFNALARFAPLSYTEGAALPQSFDAQQAELQKRQRLHRSPQWQGSLSAEALSEAEMKTLRRLLIIGGEEISLRLEAMPTTRALEAHYEERAADFPTEDWVEGARIFIPRNSGMKSELVAVMDRLEAGESFEIVARDYYRDRGDTSNGYFGRAVRSGMHPTLFAEFWAADPNADWFGPVERRVGMMVCKLYDKGTSGVLPLRSIRPILEGELYAEKLAKLQEKQWNELTAGHEVQLVSPENPEALTEDAVLAILDGEPIDYAQALALTPGVFGTMTDPAFARVAAKGAVRNSLVLDDKDAIARLDNEPAMVTLRDLILLEIATDKLIENARNAHHEPLDEASFRERARLRQELMEDPAAFAKAYLNRVP